MEQPFSIPDHSETFINPNSGGASGCFFEWGEDALRPPESFFSLLVCNI